MAWLFYALAAAVIWGVNYAACGRLLGRGLSPQTLFFADMVFGTIAMALFLTATGRWHASLQELRLERADLAWLAVALGAATTAGLLIFLSIEARNATVASLIEVTYPLFTALFTWAFFRQATMNAATLLGALLIFAGVVIVARGNR